jgi:superfamily II RNA helicase
VRPRPRSIGTVGLKTGDAAINPDARIVVMTTEILRNMLYRTAGGGAPDSSLTDVGLVVLDEVHYLSDADRGTVWEECIIYSPPAVPLLCLSATVGNPDDLQGWISAVHGPCELVTSSWRPVPLTFMFAKRGGDDERGGGWPGLGPLLSRRGDRMNRALEEPAADARDKSGPRMVSSWRKDAPSQESVVRHLVREDLLPAIWFIFSRARCDEAVVAVKTATSLVTPEERARLSAALEGLRSSNPEALRPEYAEPLLAGVAAHHAGCLPAWKTLVEGLFQEGLIKLVFATETLAAGINMPARAVVLSSTSKRDAEGPRSLTVNEFMQMAGRAGRRGYDTQGAVVVVQSPFEGPGSAAELALGQPEVRAHACLRA